MEQPEDTQQVVLPKPASSKGADLSWFPHLLEVPCSILSVLTEWRAVLAVVIFFKAVGDAPILKQAKVKVSCLVRCPIPRSGTSSPAPT